MHHFISFKFASVYRGKNFNMQNFLRQITDSSYVTMYAYHKSHIYRQMQSISVRSAQCTHKRIINYTNIINRLNLLKQQALSYVLLQNLMIFVFFWHIKCQRNYKTFSPIQRNHFDARQTTVMQNSLFDNYVTHHTHNKTQSKRIISMTIKVTRIFAPSNSQQ